MNQPNCAEFSGHGADSSEFIAHELGPVQNLTNQHLSLYSATLMPLEFNLRTFWASATYACILHQVAINARHEEFTQINLDMRDA